MNRVFDRHPTTERIVRGFLQAEWKLALPDDLRAARLIRVGLLHSGAGQLRVLRHHCGIGGSANLWPHLDEYDRLTRLRSNLTTLMTAPFYGEPLAARPIVCKPNHIHIILQSDETMVDVVAVVEVAPLE